MTRIAFVMQPGTPAGPPSGCDSIAIWTDRLIRRLPADREVTVYGRPVDGRSVRGQHSASGAAPDAADGRCRYRGVSSRLDQAARVLRLADRFGLGNPRRPVFASPLYYRGYGMRIARDLRRRGADLVHVHNYSQFVPAIRALNPDIGIVLHMHCEWLSQLDPALIEPRIARADRVIGCSEHVSARIRRAFPRHADRIETVFNGVDCERFADAPDPNAAPCLLFVGRISPEKGLHVLLEAFRQLAPAYPGLTLRIVGPVAITARERLVGPSDEARVAALARFYKGNRSRSDYPRYLRSLVPAALADRVVFSGGVSPEQLPAVYRQATLLVNPSLSEAFGMSLVEAMASGVPVVASRVGGMTEIVEHERSGWLVEPDDAPALAAALRGLLDDGTTRRRLALAGRERVRQRFAWERVAEQLLGVHARMGYRHG